MLSNPANPQGTARTDINVEIGPANYSKLAEALAPYALLDTPFGGGKIWLRSCYLANGQNTVYLPAATDPAISQYFTDQGFVGEARTFDNWACLAGQLRADEQLCYSALTTRALGAYSIVNGFRRQDAENKKYLRELTNFAPPKVRCRFDEVSGLDYRDLADQLGSGTLYVKLLNGEHSGQGAFRCVDGFDLARAINTARKIADEKSGSQEIIIEAGIDGVSKSVQLFLPPDTPTQPQLLGVSEQILADNGTSFLGAENRPVSSEEMARLSPVILDFVQKLVTKCPSVAGFVGFDYIDGSDGKIYVHDISPRTTANTTPLVLTHWLRGGSSDSEAHAIKFSANLHRYKDFSKLRETLGPLMEREKILETGFGVLPEVIGADGWYNLVAIAPSEDEALDLVAEDVYDRFNVLTKAQRDPVQMIYCGMKYPLFAI